MPKKRTGSRKLTELIVKGLKPEAKQVDHFDSACPGLALRVSPRGKKTWCLFYRGAAKSDPSKTVVKRLKLGTYPALKLSETRDEARRYQRSIERGEDPLTIKAHQKAEAQAARTNTVSAVVDEFFKRHAKRQNRSWEETRKIFDRHVLPIWGDRPIASITRRDALDLLDSLVDRDMPIMANRVLAHIRKLFNWCIERDILESTPIAQIKAPGKEVVRDRALEDHEITAVWEAFDELDYPFGPMFKLMLATGQRRGEVAEMKWSEVTDSLWTIPKERAKSDRANAVPLPAIAQEILESVPRFKGDYVFSGSGGQKPVSGYSNAKRRAERMCDVDHWTLHDLRRTVATQMAGLGISGEVIGRVLNHAPRGVTAQVYNKHSYLPEKTRALETWGRKLQTLTGRTVDDKVVDLAEMAAQ
jgi:integrase